MKKLFTATLLGLALLAAQNTAQAYNINDFKPENQKILKKIFKEKKVTTDQLVQLINSEVGREVVKYDKEKDKIIRVKNGQEIHYLDAYDSITNEERQKLLKFDDQLLDELNKYLDKIVWGARPAVKSFIKQKSYTK